VAGALKPVYTTPNAKAARAELDAFTASELDRKNPNVTRAFERAWEQFIPFLAFPPEVRRVIYTTNSIESLNYQMRKDTKTASKPTCKHDNQNRSRTTTYTENLTRSPQGPRPGRGASGHLRCPRRTQSCCDPAVLRIVLATLPGALHAQPARCGLGQARPGGDRGGQDGLRSHRPRGGRRPVGHRRGLPGR
jgi:hypothetical protein